MNGKRKELREKGEFDYDYVHDTLFFKCKDRPYDRSLELDNIVVDVDEEGFIVGLQIFDASDYFNVAKQYIRLAKAWKMQANVEKISDTEAKIEVRLVFQVVIRNKIVQPSPIITQNVNDRMESSQMVCVPVSR